MGNSVTDAQRDKLLLLLLSGMRAEALQAAAVEKIGIPADKAKGAIAEARRCLTRAADYSRDEQLGAAISRLNDLYTKASVISDVKTCLSIQRELNKLLDLYAAPDTPPGGDNADLEAIRGYLLPLGLGHEGTPITELCRRAAAELVKLQHE